MRHDVPLRSPRLRRIAVLRRTVTQQCWHLGIHIAKEVDRIIRYWLPQNFCLENFWYLLKLLSIGRRNIEVAEVGKAWMGRAQQVLLRIVFLDA